jgi:hypothetical protein
MNVTFDFDSPEDFTTYVYETAGPWGLSNQTQQRKEEILKAVTEVARKYMPTTTL